MMAKACKSIYVFSVVKNLVDSLSHRFPHLSFINVPTISRNEKLHKQKNKEYSAESDVTEEQKNILKDAEILIADPTVLGGSILNELPKLKWIQSTWAGVDSILKKLDQSKPLPSVQLTKCSGQYGPGMAEYTISQIVMRERKFIRNWEDMKNNEWNSEIKNVRYLYSLSIGILGAGDIGNWVAKCAKAFNMTVWGLIRRDVPKDERSPHYDHFRLTSEIDELLESCDYIVNILPSTPETRGFLDNDRLKVCQKRNGCFINIGRGDVISEESVIKALKNNWISYAILDVFNQEPLPKSSPLWEMENVFITPHVACLSSTDTVIDVFEKNYERYINEKPLLYLLDWKLGY